LNFLAGGTIELNSKAIKAGKILMIILFEKKINYTTTTEM